MTAVFVCVTIDIFIPCASNLKAKRQVVNSIVDRLRTKTVSSVCQAKYHDLWQKSQLGLAIAANDKTFAEKELIKVKKILYDYDQIQVTDFIVEYL